MATTSMTGRRQFLQGIAAGAAIMAMPKWSRAATAARRLEGVFPIAFTVVDAQDRVDFDALAAQMRFCQRGGVHGLAWPQIASGWTTLSEEERIHGADVLVSASRGSNTAVVIGVQSKTGDFKETERYAKHAEKLGADAIICIAPPGVAPGPGLLSFYQRLGKVTSLPLFIQTGGDFSVDLVVEMFNTIPTFRHVKDEAGDPLERIVELKARTGNNLKVFSGRGVTTLMTEMELGFVGHCPFVSLADLYAGAYDSYHSGKQQQAFDQFGRIQAFSSMFAQSDVNVLIARGVFKPGSRTRMAPPAAGAEIKHARPSDPEQIRRQIEQYLKPYLRAG